MRVIHLGKYYPPASGGIETHTQTLARAQAALGTDVRVVVVNHANAVGHDATFSSTTRTPTREDADGPVRIYRAGKIANVAKLDVTPGILTSLRKLQRDPPDVWHLHTPNVTMMLALAAIPSIRPLVVTHHSDIVRQRVLRHAVRPLELAVYRRAARILPTNPLYVDRSPLLQRHRAKLAVLPLGSELAPFREPSAAVVAVAGELARRCGSPLWLAVGRLISYKGLSVALEALRRVPGRLVLVGTGPLEAALRAQAAAVGVADRVVFHGHATADQIAGAYRAATALWFPSTARSEGFGIVQVEAMASGCPVINTAIPGSGVPWVCRHDREGLTVPTHDPAALAAAAQRLLDEPGLRDRLAAAGVRRSVDEFDHRVMAERSLAIYRGVVA